MSNGLKPSKCDAAILLKTAADFIRTLLETNAHAAKDKTVTDVIYDTTLTHEPKDRPATLRNKRQK